MHSERRPKILEVGMQFRKHKNEENTCIGVGFEKEVGSRKTTYIYMNLEQKTELLEARLLSVRKNIALC